MLSQIIYKVLKVPNTMHIEIATPKRFKATIIFLHGIGVSNQMWQKIETNFAQDHQIIKVDLLGFGQSPTKTWLKYDLADQARSLFLTLLKNNKVFTLKPVIVVGHSLGALIAVEFASRHRLLVKQLVLVSPPIYLHQNNPKEKILISAYNRIINNRHLLSSVFRLGKTFYNYTSNMSPDSRYAFTKSLQTAIIQQNIFTKLAKIRIPTQIVYGVLDPLIVIDNFKHLPQINPRISLASTIAFHDVKGLLVSKVIRCLKNILQK